jgi:phosphoribosyl 1,2-cyclic phosphate phosphodiesterase
MKITFLGTGTSQGIPVIACPCEVCNSIDPRDKRLRCSVHIEWEDASIVIDTGPDFRQQMLRERIKRVDAVLYTHEHKDHLAGLDDVRAFNFLLGKHMDIYASSCVEEAIRREFAYIFAEDKYPGIPLLNMHRITKEPFQLLGKTIVPIEVSHYKLPVLGFRIGDFAYITDAKSINERETEKLKGVHTLVINALRRETHNSHFTLSEALEFIAWVKPKRAYLTHLSHQMGTHAATETELPNHVNVAFDGLQIECI